MKINDEIRIIAKYKLIPSNYIVKYDKEEYIRSMYEEGKFRMKLASNYNDTSHNPARRDNELERSFSIQSSKCVVEYGGQILETAGDIILKSNFNIDYYVFCLSKIYKERLFDEFEANACFIIIKPKEFLMKFFSILRENYPEWGVWGNDISYYDPSNTSLKDINALPIPFNKEIKFAYQEEYRMILCNPNFNYSTDPPHIDVNLGSLKQYGEIVLKTDKQS